MSDDGFPSWGCFIAVMLVVLLLLGGMAWDFISYQTAQEAVTLTVAKKEMSRARWVWSTDGEPFVVADAFWYGHLRSAEVYGALDEGKTYTVFVIGKRRPFPNEYRNIIRIMGEE
jgi:hypothetical protein